MANTVGGSVVWNLTVDSGQFDKGIDQAATKANKFASDVKKVDFGSMASNASQSFGRVADSIGGVLRGLALMSVASGFGFGAMTKAAFAQVKQVEGATFALKAYETNGKKVTKVLSDLVKYARSDTGVLFQRQDLFDAASTLKIYGVETKNLTRYTKIMSKGVAIGKIGFQELSEVLGRVSSQGELTSDSFDILVRRGIKLPASMRNAKVSAEELFKALDKSLPDSILTGRANTIEGRMIRLQSAFRDLGGAILGVDKETSTFIKGGLGDQFVKTLEDLRAQLRDPAMVEAFQKMGKAVGDFTKNAIPVLFNAFKWLISNYDTVVAAIAAIGAAFIAAKIGEFASGVVEAVSGFNKFTAAVKGGASAMSAMAGGASPIGLIVLAIVALVAAMVYLQIKFGIFTKLWNTLKSAAEPVVAWFQKNILPTLEKIGTFISGQFKSAWNDLVSSFKEVQKQIQPFMPQLKILGGILLVSVLAPLALIVVGVVVFIGIIVALVTVITRLIGWFSKLITFIIPIGKAIWSVLVWTFNLAKTVILAFLNVITTVFTFVFNILKTLFNIWLTVWTGIFKVIGFVIALILAIVIFAFKAIWSVIGDTVMKIWSFIVAYFTLMFNVWKTIFTAIWNVVKTVFMGIWNTIKTIATSIWNTLVSIFNSIKNTATTIWDSIYNTIKNNVNKVKDAIVGIKDRVMGVFRSVGSWLSNAGRDLISGLINGIKSMAGTLKDKITGFIKDNVPGPVLKVLGIHSPSKVFADIGSNIVTGLSRGISDGKDLLKSTSLNMAANVTAPSIMAPEVVGASATGGTYITNEIGSITLANDVDADRFIQKLTQQDDIISRGLTPQRYSNG